MIDLAKIKEAERMLAEGTFSHRKIAKAVGISRATVGKIASGERPDYEARRLARASEPEPTGPLTRCSGCGGMVHTPCRLCRIRKLKAQQQEVARAVRRRTREQALRRLVAAVRKASQEREAAQHAADHLPAAATGGASDCR